MSTAPAAQSVNAFRVVFRDLLSPLKSRVPELLTRQVKHRGLVLWYDPEKAYTKLAQSLNLPDNLPDFLG